MDVEIRDEAGAKAELRSTALEKTEVDVALGVNFGIDSPPHKKNVGNATEVNCRLLNQPS